MFHRLAKVLVLIAAVQILGGHWAVLQSLAWSRMLIENVQTAPLREAVMKTFDGSNPCSLCVVVKQGRESEEQQATPKLLVKLEAILAASVVAPEPAAAPLLQTAITFASVVRTHSPPTPPPRFA